MELYGASHSPINPYGILWSPMKPHGPPMKSYEVPWSPTEPNGALWSSMEFCEALCSPVEVMVIEA